MLISKFWRTVLLFGQGLEKEEKASAISELVAQLSANFEQKGFRYESPYGFRKRHAELTWSFALGISAKYDAVIIRPAASVRHEIVERLFHTVSLAPETVQRESVTLPWQRALEKRVPKPESFTINRPSNLARSVEFTDRFFTKWIEPFFRENSDMAAIDRGFNDRRAVLRSKSVYDWFEMLGRAIIAAKLVARRDYKEIAREYREHLRDHGSGHPDPAQAFDALAQHLEQSL